MRKSEFTVADHKKAYLAYRECKNVFSEVKRKYKELPSVVSLIKWSDEKFQCNCIWHNYKRLDFILQKAQKDVENYASLTPAGRKKIFTDITGAVTILDDIDAIELALLKNIDTQIELGSVIDKQNIKLKKQQKILDRGYFKELIVDDAQKLADYHAIRTLVLTYIFNAKFPDIQKFLDIKEPKWTQNLGFNSMGEAVKTLAEVDKQISLLTGEHPTEITETRHDGFDYEFNKLMLEAVRSTNRELDQEELKRKLVELVRHKK
ncbi:hypothetical protein M0R19_05775 [Candidatus Pacearchaeota archaeon]|jgi:hypothetical protein|nr:hypothetical protein [Candidatus Pacearchaeota archaeon]